MSTEGIRRLQREFKFIQSDPPPFTIALPNPKNWFEWHFAIFGLPEDTPYAGGVYHGQLKFPSNYPHGPPSIIMHTPSGRFEPDKKICTSMSDYHPESWSPVWKVSTIINGLVSFMLGDERSTGTVTSSDRYKRQAARNSLTHNMQKRIFLELFKDHIEKFEKFHNEFFGELEYIEPEQDDKKQESRYTLMAVAIVIVGIVIYKYIGQSFGFSNN